jgi:hypothetical protein
MMAAYFTNLDSTASNATSGGALVAMLSGIAGAIWMFKH